VPDPDVSRPFQLHLKVHSAGYFLRFELKQVLINERDMMSGVILEMSGRV
jgi:hypothetical protein